MVKTPSTHTFQALIQLQRPHLRFSEDVAFFQAKFSQIFAKFQLPRQILAKIKTIVSK